MREKMLLIDGHSIANRAYYGVPLLTNKDGIYTNAIFGFINMMLSIIDKEKPDYLGIAFDLSVPTFRHQLSESYKGNRKGMPPELKEQIPLLKQVLDAMHIHMISKEGFEADDVLGTLAKLAEKDGVQVTIMSGDRDLFQVTSDLIELKIPRTKKTGTEIESFFAKDVVSTYGVTPTEFIDVKGLMGDPSDNIKGVPGIGEKTAIRLIKEYGNIENLLEQLDSIKQKKLKENLTTYSNDAIESKKLATIICDVPLDVSREDFKFDLTLDKEAQNLLMSLDLKSLLSKLPKAGTEDQANKIQPEYIPLELFMKELSGHAPYSLSYFVDDDILGLSLCKGHQVFYNEWHLNDPVDILWLQQFMSNPNYSKIIHDSKPFKHILSKYNIQVAGVLCDTLIGAYLLYPTHKDYSLPSLEDLFLNHRWLQSEESLLGKGKKQVTWLTIEEEIRKNEISLQAIILIQIHDILMNTLREEGMIELFTEVEMPLIDVLFDMEQVGISVDMEGLKKYGAELQTYIDQLALDIYDMAGEEFNINSPKQLGVILFEHLGIPPVKKTKTGYSTAAEVLETLKHQYPIIEKILEYRQYTKLNSTYVDGLLAVLTPDHKIHSTFNQAITATGRLSSTEPNLQNIPVKFEMGRKIRGLFIPSTPEYVFLDADYSQIELRVLAHISKDPILIDAFKHNMDIHALTASQVFNIPVEDVSATQRSNAKAVNFGIVYGISAFALAEDLKISQKEAQRYIDGYFEKYPEIQHYVQDTIAYAMENGYVKTLYNRKREIPEILSSNYNLREFGKRVAMNTPIQGTAADIIKIAMIHVYQKLKALNLQSKLILTVHDELLIEAHLSEVDLVKTLLKEEMENAITLSVPLDVDVHQGVNWLEAK